MAIHEKRQLRPEPPDGFWQGLSFEELARLQRVEPVDRLEALLGGWPAEEVGDSFEAELAAWRRESSPDRDGD